VSRTNSTPRKGQPSKHVCSKLGAPPKVYSNNGVNHGRRGGHNHPIKQQRAETEVPTTATIRTKKETRTPNHSSHQTRDPRRDPIHTINQVEDQNVQTNKKKLNQSPTKRSPTPKVSPCSSRAPSRALSTTSKYPSSCPSSQAAPKYKFIIRKIPEKFSTQKAFYTLLVTVLGLKSISVLKVNHNRTTLLITNAPLSPQLPEDHSDRHKLSRDNHHPHQPEKSRTKVSPQKTHLLDCHPRRLREHHRRRDFHPLSLTVDSETNKPTSFIRVLSTGEETVDDTLFKGVDLYGYAFVCETSHPPTPTPLQCPRCFQFGHELAESTNKPQMSRMSPSQQVLRQGALLPWSCSCP
jgi:hypothetical protein